MAEGSDAGSVMAESDTTMVSDFAHAAHEPLSDVKNKIMTGVIDMCKTHGGPVQYLKTMLPDLPSQSDFAQYLWNYFPESDEHFYTTTHMLPPVSGDNLAEAPLCVHVAVLGFHTTCSLKPPPGSAKTIAMAEQYVVDGFCSQGDPVLVVQSRRPDDIMPVDPPWTSKCSHPITPFSVGYMKGMCRATTLIAMIHWCWKAGVDLKVEHPILYKSVLAIFVHHTQQSSRVDECLQNMKQSSRGSLRKMTNVIEVVFMIKGLTALGMNDFASFVRRWNSMCAKSHQIIGKRSLALKLLFEVAPEACVLI